jgi:phosphate transport system ATP-binding protein
MLHPFGDFALQFEKYTLRSGFIAPLQDISFSLERKESLALIGPTGSGKSMLVYVISQMIWDVANRPETLRQNGLCKILGYQVTPKKPSLPTLTVLQSMIAVVGERSAWLPLPLCENFRVSQILAGSQNPITYYELMNALPLSLKNKSRLLALAELMPKQVESPLLQQLAIIRALLRKPALLLLDEPFGRMDPVLLRQTESLILELGEESTIVWATNDLHQASRITDRTVFMLNGKVRECTPTPEFFANPRTREAESFIAGHDDDG